MNLLSILLSALALLPMTSLTLAEDTMHSDAVTAIVGAHIIPMDGERVIENQTIVVRDGVIEQIGSAEDVDIPSDATLIEAHGAWLIPGLVDMHIHAMPQHFPNQMELLVLNGVTTVRNMIGNPGLLQLKQRIISEDLLAPTLFTCGVPVVAQTVQTPQQGADLVREQKEAGYDFVKVHSGISGETYAAIAEAAAKVGMPLAGHVIPEFGLRAAMEAGQQIEHLDGYYDLIVADDAPVKQSTGQITPGEIMKHIDAARLQALAAEMAERSIWNCPTMALFAYIGVSDEPAETFLAWPEMAYVPPKFRQQWAQQRTGLLAQLPGKEMKQLFGKTRGRILRALRDAGAPLLAGSDSPQFFMVSGFALHRELQAMQAAGLTPYEVLQAATVNPARWFGDDSFGTIAVGKRADLVLLAENPLEDIAAADQPLGVMLRGRWLSQEEIDSRLEAIAEKNE